MNAQEIKDYWGDKLVTYPHASSVLGRESLRILEEVGLPRELRFEFFKFFPLDQLEVKIITSRSFLFLGKLFDPSLENFGIVLELDTQRLYLFNQFYYELGMKSSPIAYANSDLLTFLIFAKKFLQFLEDLISKKEKGENLTFYKNQYRDKFIALKEDLKLLDPLAFKGERNFWREPLLEIRMAIDGFDEPPSEIVYPIDVTDL